MSAAPIVAWSEPMPAQGGHMEGSSPLAGTFGLPSLLVRECVQNSWDARDDERTGPVRFEIEGRDLDTDELDHLRSLLPVRDLEGFNRDPEKGTQGLIHPADLLDQDEVRVLVISDRNTVGLCGPSRSGFQWEPVRRGVTLPRGQQRFANFVRNMGRAASNVGLGDGGAFGIGKSVLWMASTCGTVLIHSRTTDEHGDPVERFIGSIHGESFDSGGRQYTGRHFIGWSEPEVSIEPLVGAEAAHAATGLRLPDYWVGGEHSFGTTIVIVGPRLHLPWGVEMERLRDAVRWQVWPKRLERVRGTGTGPDMEMRLGWNGNDVPVPPPLEDPEIRPYAKTLLDSARDRCSDEPGRDHDAWCRRPQQLLGTTRFRSAGTSDDNVFHLTLTEGDIREKSGIDPDDSEGDVEPAVDFSAPWGKIALIRRQPLLLVRYESIGGSDQASAEVGVFLSSDFAEVEEALTLAEPPAHDDWIHKLVPKDHSKDHRRTLAKKTIDEVKAARKRFVATLQQTAVGHRGGGEQQVSKLIFEGLLGGLGGGVSPAPAGRSGSTASRGPKAELSLVRSDQNGSCTIHEVDVSLRGVGKEQVELRLTAGGKAHDSAGSMGADDRVQFAWIDSARSRTEGPELRFSGSEASRLSLVVTVESSLRFRPTVAVEVEGGS